MVEPSDGKHPEKVEKDGSCYRCPTPANPENTKARAMHRNKRNDAKPISSWWFCPIEVFCIHPGIEPPYDGRSEVPVGFRIRGV